jgi:outer membrane protein assembly factor BamB
MKRNLLVSLICASLICVVAFAQNPGDQPTAGYTNSRSYLNSDAGNFKAPFELDHTLNLPEGTSAETLSVFEQYILVGQGGEPGSYLLLNRSTGTLRWSNALVSSPSPLNYAPAFNNDIVLLGGSTTTSVAAVQASTGDTLWTADRVGASDGHFPILTNDLALYEGRFGVVAARPSDGMVIWQNPSTAAIGSVEVAKAPLSVYGSRVYGIAANGNLFALDLLTGEAIWSAPMIGADGSNVIATRKYVYVNDPSTGTVNAIRTSNGSTAWSVELDGTFGRPGIALAYNQLFVFYYSTDAEIKVAALNPQTGELVWETVDPGRIPLPEPVGVWPPRFGQVVNNAVYFYNPLTSRIRVLDAFSGNTLWSINMDDVAGMSVADDALYVLLPDRIQEYRPSNTIYLSEIADGMGDTTLITLANLSPDVAVGTLEFLDDDGNPVAIGVQGLVDPVTSVDFSLQPNGTVRVQTTGLSDPLVTGWVRATANRPIRGTAVFQTNGPTSVLFEAGVGDAPATGQANLFVSQASPFAGSIFNTGVAIANPLDEPTDVHLTFRRRLPAAGVFYATLTLEPGQHMAQFVHELFGPDEAPVGSEGTLIIESDIPVVITALRTQNGYQMSSYPVGIPGK